MGALSGAFEKRAEKKTVPRSTKSTQSWLHLLNNGYLKINGIVIQAGYSTRYQEGGPSLAASGPELTVRILTLKMSPRQRKCIPTMTWPDNACGQRNN